MATTLKRLTVGSAVSVLTTELNALVEGATSTVGGALNNIIGTANLDGAPVGEFELVVAAPPVATTAGVVYLWLLRQVDGSNYEDGGSGVIPKRAPDVAFYLQASASAQRVVGVRGSTDQSTPIPLPIGNFKGLAVQVGTGTIWAATGSTIKVRAATEQQV